MVFLHKKKRVCLIKGRKIPVMLHNCHSFRDDLVLDQGFVESGA